MSAAAGTWVLAAGAMLLLVLAPALWNGFPLIFPDTGGYLARPITGTLELGRSALYGLFLYAGMALHFWPNIVAQAALTVWLIVLTLRAHGLGGRLLLATGIAGVLTIATGMPWYADTAMPDILLPDAILALHLLAFRAAQLRGGERFALVAVIACAIASHMGTLALCIALLSAFTLASLLPLPRPRLTLPATAALLGLALAPLSNWAITGTFALTPGGETFLFGRLVQDGIVARYLNDRCPDPSLRICDFKNEMPTTADDWLWAPGNPLGKLGGWRGYQPETRRIITETMQMYPAMHIKEAVVTTAEQFVTMKTEVSTNPDWIAPGVEALGKLTPWLMPRFKASRQLAAHQQIDALLAVLNVVHVAVAGLSILALFAALLLWRRWNLAPHDAAFAAIVVLALAGNAVICGTFSNPVDRYQSRLVWLAPFALIVIVANRKMRGASQVAPAGMRL